MVGIEITSTVIEFMIRGRMLKRTEMPLIPRVKDTIEFRWCGQTYVIVAVLWTWRDIEKDPHWVVRIELEEEN